jgi:GrpB-like predicted nucleotidyltransferase (UPF0157 family)
VSEEDLRAATIGEPTVHDAKIHLAEYDPGWPGRYADEAARIRAALGAEVLAVEHVGSTSVPGLAAKPVIDIDLVVPDSANEDAYVPALEAAGYVLRIREPDWFEHRMLVRERPKVQVHVFSRDCPEIERMLAFRDRLRGNDADRELYERTKRELAVRTWRYVQDYADAKTDVVEDIMTRALPRET